MNITSTELFTPPEIAFQPVSMGWIKARWVEETLTTLIFFIPAVVVAVVFPDLPYLWALPVVVFLLWAWRMWLIPRQVKAWGYCLTDTELVLHHGIMFRRLVAIPYGRMQYVDVAQGPVDRFFGIASVKMFTASAESNAHVGGMDLEAAKQLRETLMQRGEAQRSGL